MSCLSCLFWLYVGFKNIWLISTIWLIKIIPAIISRVFLLLLILIQIISVFRLMWLMSCELFVCWIFVLSKKMDDFNYLCCSFCFSIKMLIGKMILVFSDHNFILVHLCCNCWMIRRDTLLCCCRYCFNYFFIIEM